MSSNKVRIFLQYRIKYGFDNIYIDAIKQIAHMMDNFDVEQFDCFPTSLNCYVESFYVPTESHFHALKKLRKTKGYLNQIIEGGVNGIQWIALKRV